MLCLYVLPTLDLRLPTQLPCAENVMWVTHLKDALTSPRVLVSEQCGTIVKIIRSQPTKSARVQFKNVNAKVSCQLHGICGTQHLHSSFPLVRGGNIPCSDLSLSRLGSRAVPHKCCVRF